MGQRVVDVVEEERFCGGGEAILKWVSLLSLLPTRTRWCSIVYQLTLLHAEGKKPVAASILIESQSLTKSQHTIKLRIERCRGIGFTRVLLLNLLGFLTSRRRKDMGVMLRDHGEFYELAKVMPELCQVWGDDESWDSAPRKELPSSQLST